MEQIIITRIDTSTWPLLSKSAVTVVTKAEQRKSLMGENVIAMSVESAVKLEFGLRDYITVFGEKYFLNSLPKQIKNGNRKFSYEIIWESRQYDLLKPLFLDEDIDGISISPDFSLTGNLSFLMGVLINNCKRIYGTGNWVLGDCPTTDYKTLTFSNENCLSVLQRLCKEDCFDKEFEIVENSGICTINIKDEIGQILTPVYEYGKGNGLFSLTRETVSDKNIITRLYAFGSNKNLKSDYRGFSQRLKLPGNDKSYIEDAGAIAAYGKIEGVKIFEEIYPHHTGTISSLGASTIEFYDTSMDFDLNAIDGTRTLYLVQGTSAKIHFNTGKLAGYEFAVSQYIHGTKKFKVQSFTDDRGQIFPDPNSSAFQFSVGDKYVILDILMPDSYVTAAETELQNATDEYYDLVSQPRVQYSQVFDELFFKQLYSGSPIANVFGIGDYVHIKDADIGVDKSIRLKSFKRDISNPYRYTLDLYDYSEESLLNRILSASKETSRVISSSNITSTSKINYNQKLIDSLLNYIIVTDLGTENPGIRIKLPVACDFGLKTYRNSGQLPPSIWDSLPVASATVPGIVMVGDGGGLSIVDGVLSASGESYTFQHSIVNVDGTVNLVNDSAAPGNNKMYGTDGSGLKGWINIPSSMVYPGAGIALSNGIGWDTPVVNNSANWNAAYGWGDHALAGYATISGLNSAIAALVNSSPATLDTLNELAAALGNDPNFATTIATTIGLKAPLASPVFTGLAQIDGANQDADLTVLKLTHRAGGIKSGTALELGANYIDYAHAKLIGYSNPSATTDSQFAIQTYGNGSWHTGFYQDEKGDIYLSGNLRVLGSIKSYSGSVPSSWWLDMPYASDSVVGGIKVGSGLSINADTGVLSVDFTGYAHVANPVFTGKAGIGVAAFTDLTLQAGVHYLGWEENANAASRRWWMGADQQAYGDFYIMTTSVKGLNYPDVVRLYFSPAGDAWFSNQVSAASFYDRTPFYAGDALSEIMLISGKDGEVDHDTLPEFVRKERLVYPSTETISDSLLITEDLLLNKVYESAIEQAESEQIDPMIVPERDLGAMISMLTVAVQQLKRENDELRQLMKS